MANIKLKKYVLIPFLVILTLGMILFVLINPLLEKTKPALLDAVSKAAGSKVDAEVISVTLFPYPGFMLENVKSEREGKTFSVGKVGLRISILDALKGLISLASVEINNVKLSGTLHTNGTFSIDGVRLPSKDPSKTNEAAVPSTSGSETETSTDSSPSKALSLAINTLEVSDVDVSVLHEKTNVSLPLEVEKFSFKKDGEKGKLDGRIILPDGDMRLNGTVPSYKIDFNTHELNADVEVTVSSFDVLSRFLGIDISKYNISNFNAKLAVDLPRVKLEDVRVKFSNQEMLLSGLLHSYSQGGGDFTFTVDTFDISSLHTINAALQSFTGALKGLICKIALEGKEQVSVDCTLGDSQINSVRLSIPELQANSALVEPKTFSLDPFKASFAGGSILLKAQGVPGSQIKTEVRAEKLLIQELMKLAPQIGPTGVSPLEGSISSLSSNMTLQGAHKSGSFSADISPLSVKGINIFKKVSEAFEVFPAFGISLVSSLPQAYSAVLLSQNTDFSHITIKGSVQDTKIKLDNLEAKSKGYAIVGNGTMDSGSINLETTLIIEAPLVSAIEVSQPKISKIKNPDGTIVIPLEIKKSGADATLLILPDMEKLAKQQLGVQLKNNAKKALDKVSPGLGGVVDGLFN